MYLVRQYSYLYSYRCDRYLTGPAGWRSASACCLVVSLVPLGAALAVDSDASATDAAVAGGRWGRRVSG
ncbi:hypothetical protein Afil01_17240 [Actinorhabdospora filicis]|uniref:Uncharacterized protein n=1 Tax=Actinorhabdospora filicis TaxID=1785913 RepID=A0A9W6SJ57_9ACTN|nr:hypothetical protein Afil01_17240 [Actinorhabdospora filicis]